MPEDVEFTHVTNAVAELLLAEPGILVHATIADLSEPPMCGKPLQEMNLFSPGRELIVDLQVSGNYRDRVNCQGCLEWLHA